MTCRWAEKRQRPAAPQYGCRPTIYTYRAWACVRPTDVAYMGPPVMPMGFLPRQEKTASQEFSKHDSLLKRENEKNLDFEGLSIFLDEPIERDA